MHNISVFSHTTEDFVLLLPDLPIELTSSETETWLHFCSCASSSLNGTDIAGKFVFCYTLMKAVQSRSTSDNVQCAKSKGKGSYLRTLDCLPSWRPHPVCRIRMCGRRQWNRVPDCQLYDSNKVMNAFTLLLKLIIWRLVTWLVIWSNNCWEMEQHSSDKGGTNTQCCWERSPGTEGCNFLITMTQPILSCFAQGTEC